MQDEFRRFFRENFPRVFAYFYAQSGSIAQAKELASRTFEHANEEWRGSRAPPLRRPSLFVIARAVRKEWMDGTAEAGEEVSLARGSNFMLGRPDLGPFVSRLDPLDREIVSLRFDAGLNYGEIGEIVGLTRVEVGRRIVEAMRRLTALKSDA